MRRNQIAGRYIIGKTEHSGTPEKKPAGVGLSVLQATILDVEDGLAVVQLLPEVVLLPLCELVPGEEALLYRFRDGNPIPGDFCENEFVLFFHGNVAGDDKNGVPARAKIGNSPGLIGRRGHRGAIGATARSDE